MSESGSQSTSASRSGVAAPPADFQGACREAGVPFEDHAALWRLHLRFAGKPAAAQHLQTLLDNHAHWRLYASSRRGDERAAREFERYWTKRTGAFFRARFPSQDADELTAAFFERVYRLVGDSFAWPMPFSAYLRTIMLNIGRDHVKSAMRRKETSLDDDGPLQDHGARSSEPSPEEATLQAERMDAMRRAMWSLSPSDRHVVIALVLEESDAEVLAAELGVTRNALYQRLHRARGRLKKACEKEGLW